MLPDSAIIFDFEKNHREIESSCIRKAIDDQILPEGIEPEVKNTFIQFLQENPSKVLMVLDALDEADPENVKLFRELIQRELFPGCFIVFTSRHEAGSNIRPYTDTLLEIIGFTRTYAKCRGVSANLNCRNWNLERGLAISRGLATLEIKRLKTWLKI